MANEWIPYDEQLKDFRWKWLRLDVLERDKHICRKCARPDNLQVHHKYYESGKLAWEYPIEALITLCRRCHAREHNLIEGQNPYPCRKIGESRPVLSIRAVMIEFIESLINGEKEREK